MKKLLLSNFKSNKSITEASSWLDIFLEKVSALNLTNFDLAVAPSFLSLKDYSEQISASNFPIKLTTQNISAYPAGSYTGAVSVKNLEGLNLEYAIVGHSERRKYFGENSELVAKKVEQAIDGGMTPVVCLDTEYLEEQISAIDSNLLEQCIFAYEPLSAIGSGNNADVGTVKEVSQKIKTLAGEVPVLYGGSVTDQNVLEYLLVADGVLVGSFSLDPSQFAQLVTTVATNS
jgi:triosephosphate isomerase